MEKLITAFSLLFRPVLIRRIFSLYHQGYLRERGWFESALMKQSVNKDNSPLIWCTYPFIDFISARLKNDMSVFEYGCGNSTLWFSEKVKKIDSVEHNRKWFERINSLKPGNSNVVLKEESDPEGYAKAVRESNERYDIIFIDGIERNKCIKYSIDSLKSGGIIILDNSERKDYSESFSFLKDAGFKNIDFFGISPIVNCTSCTTIFYKSDNCLGI